MCCYVIKYTSVSSLSWSALTPPTLPWLLPLCPCSSHFALTPPTLPEIYCHQRPSFSKTSKPNRRYERVVFFPIWPDQIEWALTRSQNNLWVIYWLVIVKSAIVIVISENQQDIPSNLRDWLNSDANKKSYGSFPCPIFGFSRLCMREIIYRTWKNSGYS